ncbi:hypothetical protein Tco_0063043 [Tanacetum coccineum]
MENGTRSNEKAMASVVLTYSIPVLVVHSNEGSEAVNTNEKDDAFLADDSLHTTTDSFKDEEPIKLKMLI